MRDNGRISTSEPLRHNACGTSNWTLYMKSRQSKLPVVNCHVTQGACFGGGAPLQAITSLPSSSSMYRTTTRLVFRGGVRLHGDRRATAARRSHAAVVVVIFDGDIRRRTVLVCGLSLRGATVFVPGLAELSVNERTLTSMRRQTHRSRTGAVSVNVGCGIGVGKATAASLGRLA